MRVGAGSGLRGRIRRSPPGAPRAPLPVRARQRGMLWLKL